MPDERRIDQAPEDIDSTEGTRAGLDQLRTEVEIERSLSESSEADFETSEEYEPTELSEDQPMEPAEVIRTYEYEFPAYAEDFGEGLTGEIESELEEAPGENPFAKIMNVVREFLESLADFDLGGIFSFLGSGQESDEMEGLGTLPEGLSADEALVAARQNPLLNFLVDPDASDNFNYFFEKVDDANEHTNSYIGRDSNARYNFYVSANAEDYRDGDKDCANYVSAVLGLSPDAMDNPGAISSVRRLIPYLMRQNYERAGDYGIRIGFQNFDTGDVIAFRGTPEYAEGRYGHVAIVNRRFTVNGREFLAIQHDGSDIQVVFVPVNPADNDYLEVLEEIYDDPVQRADIPAFAWAYDYRSSHPDTVKFRENRGYYGDASQVADGRAAFAVRTSHLFGTPNLNS